MSKEDVRRLPPERKANVPDVMVLNADRSRVLHPDSAAAQLFLVSDFQCAGCRSWFEQVLPTIRSEYVDAGKVRLTFVHYPLREHPNAVTAANAAMCAGAQGKFFEASAQIFATQARWGTASDAGAALDSVASVPGVDGYALRECTSSHRMLRQIRLDIDWADKAGLGAPPIVLIGTRHVAGTVPLATLRATIDSVLAGH